MGSHNGHQHNHEHDHPSTQSNRRLLFTLVAVVIVMVAEFIGGLVSNSLALIGDAGHMLVDALALGLAFFAMNLARRPATSSRTFGYYRVEILAALINGTALILVSLYIFYEAYHRINSPPEIDAPIMITIAVIGLLANLAGIFLLETVRHGNLNVKAAFLHIVGDAISSVGVIIGGIVIAMTGITIIDPIIAAVIGIIILWGAARVVIESVNILLEAVPRGISTIRVAEMIKGVAGVRDIHDLHIWTITSYILALSAHLVIDDRTVSSSADIVREVNDNLDKQFNIRHTTLQVECKSCPSNGICYILPADQHDNGIEDSD